MTTSHAHSIVTHSPARETGCVKREFTFHVSRFTDRDFPFLKYDA